MSDLASADQQDIRFAVVLNGGVSLAVWISGVVFELHGLVQEGRAPAGKRDGVVAGLLDLLQATVRVDVIAGTSAGGLNGGFLALGLEHGCDLSKMRDLWRDQGDIASLLRDPRGEDAPSLLRGEYFYDALAAAYRDILATRPGRAAPAGEHVDLYLTGTLWDGRRSAFTDDMGRRIVEVDHDATFHFSSHPATVGTDAAGNLRDADVHAQLAVASRCTSSFPGAFEPFHVTVERAAAGDRWPSQAGLANFSDSQFVVDGGVLRNKPVRPAIDAVYRQAASRQVRRVLAYVVPDPGEQKAGDTRASSEVPHAHEVLLEVLTRMRSTDSVAEELAEIERRNDDARQRRRTRDRLAQAFLDAGADQDLAAAAFPAYREVRNESAARTVSRLLLSAPQSRRWSPGEVATVLRDLAAGRQGLPFVPAAGRLQDAREAPVEQWRWGQSAVNRLADLTVDVLKRAVWLAPLTSQERVDIVARRDAAHAILTDIRDDRRNLDAYWRKAGVDLPPRQGEGAATAEDIARLERWLATTLTGWEETSGGRRRTALYGQAYRLATCLLRARDALLAVVQGEEAAVDPGGVERARLKALVEVLLVDARTADDVLARMLDLEVAHVAFAGASGQLEQEVELVQISSQKPDLLTGVQEHHFGAFYRPSWRVNDWLRGRLDGSTQLLQVLLDPERLRQLSLDRNVDGLLDRLRAVALGPVDGPHHEALRRAWDDEQDALRAELEVVVGTGPLPRTLPRCAARLAARLHVDVLQEELEVLADTVLHERDPLEASEFWAAQAAPALRSRPVDLRSLQRLATGSEVIGRQRVRAEWSSGSDTFSRTVTHAAAAMTSMAPSRGGPRVVRASFRALRGYALVVWVLVNRLTARSASRRSVLGAVVGAGGVLLGLGLVVPGLPVGVALAGAVLLLAATTAAALSQRRRLGWWLAARLGLAVVAVSALLTLLLWADLSGLDEPALREALLRLGAQSLAVAAVVAVGWFLAGARPRQRSSKAPPAPLGPDLVIDLRTGEADRRADGTPRRTADQERRAGATDRRETVAGR